ncbi:MAG: signal recognition particle-docking protein FtsY [Bacteroidetes bacterium]|nr:signal recognition particle-docking protein FtsY [Bacteroidota bacterium]
MGIFDRIFGRKERDSLVAGMGKTREGFLSRLARAVTGRTAIDEAMMEEIEEALISADAGIDTTVRIIEGIQARLRREKDAKPSDLQRLLREETAALLSDSSGSAADAYALAATGGKPFVILVVGVNGVGKTTTIGKLAHNFQAAGKSVLLGAADTFRAAAVDQLTIWSERTGVPIVKKEMGSDPASVAFDTVQSALARGSDIVLIDTAGRLHNKAHLMDELSKIRRVIQKVIPEAPQEVLLVLDGSTGQNAIEQARHFTAATQVTGLAITKLDGTAKGGVVLAIASQFHIPVRFIGVGEKMEDLLPFDREAFVDSLFQASETPGNPAR